MIYREDIGSTEIVSCNDRETIYGDYTPGHFLHYVFDGKTFATFEEVQQYAERENKPLVQ